MTPAVVNALEMKLRPILLQGVGLYPYPGPKDRKPVAIIHKFINGRSDYFLGNVLRSVDVVMEVAVEAYDETIESVVPTADLVHRTIMAMRSVTTPYGIVSDVYQLTPVNYPMDVNGKTLQHLGGMYRFNVLPLPPN